MEQEAHLSPCDLAEVFSQLEKADAVTLRKVQIELARMQKDSERQESARRPSIKSWLEPPIMMESGP